MLQPLLSYWKLGMPQVTFVFHWCAFSINYINKRFIIIYNTNLDAEYDDGVVDVDDVGDGDGGGISDVDPNEDGDGDGGGISDVDPNEDGDGDGGGIKDVDPNEDGDGDGGGISDVDEDAGVDVDGAGINGVNVYADGDGVGGGIDDVDGDGVGGGSGRPTSKVAKFDVMGMLSYVLKIKKKHISLL